MQIMFRGSGKSKVHSDTFRTYGYRPRTLSVLSEAKPQASAVGFWWRAQKMGSVSNAFDRSLCSPAGSTARTVSGGEGQAGAEAEDCSG